jgi:hypothetical protein
MGKRRSTRSSLRILGEIRIVIGILAKKGRNAVRHGDGGGRRGTVFEAKGRYCKENVE